MHEDIVRRQQELKGVVQADPKAISSYFMKYQPLSFNQAHFRDLAALGGPKIAFNNGKMYIGTILEGKRHGKGVIACAKGKIYEG
jgi:hypothetical protein